MDCRVSGAGDGVATVCLTGPSVRVLGQLTEQAMALIDRGFTRYQQLAGGAAPDAVRCGRGSRRR